MAEGDAGEAGRRRRRAVALPQLAGKRLLLFRLFGWPLAGLTLATLAAAPFVALDAAVAAWGPLGTAFGLGSGAVALAAALLLLLRRPRDPVAALLAVAFLGIGVGTGPSGLTLAELGLETLAGLLRLAGFGALFIGVFVFPGARFEPRWSLSGSLAALVWVTVGWHGIAWPMVVPIAAFNLAGVALMLMAIAALYVRYSRTPPGTERQQIRWAALGFVVGGLLGAIAEVLRNLRDATDDRAVAAATGAVNVLLGPLAFALIALGLLVSLLRYRLYDADAAISRSAALAVLTVGLGALFAGSSEGAKIFIESSLGRDAGALPAVFAAGLAAVMLNPAYNLVSNWAERLFQKRLTALRRDLPECVEDLRETAGMDDLLDEVLSRTAAGVSAVRAAVLIGGKAVARRETTAAEVRSWRAAGRPDPAAEELDCDREDPLFPMRVPLRVRHGDRRPVGWILLGPRPDGSFYGKDEREALAEIADPVARALQVVALREAREKKLEARLAAIEAALAGGRSE